VSLAFLAAVGGFLGLPAVFGEGANKIQAFLSPIFLPIAERGEGAEHALSHATEWLLMGLSVAVAATGIVLAWKWYAKEGGRVPERLAASFPATYALVAEKFRVDELYDAIIVRPFNGLARFCWKVIDVLIIDGVLNAAAVLGRARRRPPSISPDRKRSQLRPVFPPRRRGAHADRAGGLLMRRRSQRESRIR
jgi:NADH-quinone oxidoreductase subunit L